MGLTWTAARAAAEAAGGYLATLTSAAENAFAVSLINGPTWIGGFQPAGSPEPAGNWQWVTGEPFTYTHWHPDEPNEYVPHEDYLLFRKSDGLWIDGYNELGAVDRLGYLIETGVDPATRNADIITDFTPGTDRIDISALHIGGVNALDQLLSQRGSDVLIDLSAVGGRDLLRQHTSLLSLDASDFIL